MKSLTHLLNQKNLSRRQARWLEKISCFDFEVVYVPGEENSVADALSRTGMSDNQINPCLNFQGQSDQSFITTLSAESVRWVSFSILSYPIISYPMFLIIAH